MTLTNIFTLSQTQMARSLVYKNFFPPWTHPFLVLLLYPKTYLSTRIRQLGFGFSCPESKLTCRTRAQSRANNLTSYPLWSLHMVVGSSCLVLLPLFFIIFAPSTQRVSHLGWVSTRPWVAPSSCIRLRFGCIALG